MIQPHCANCAHWDTRDGLVGFCPEITEHVRLMQSLVIRGLAPCRTAAAGRCARFEPSEEAQAEQRAVTRHEDDLRRAAGRDYPATLN